ncbi:hypothetical protein Pelo_9695 [Pelomyxa schiedti]|nr:hypothetical protein Pelo_9695 [Pelomyxa schiedti]
MTSYERSIKGSVRQTPAIQDSIMLISPEIFKQSYNKQMPLTTEFLSLDKLKPEQDEISLYPAICKASGVVTSLK